MIPIKNLTDFYTHAQDLVPVFNEFIARNTLQERVRVDHFCYKCGDSETFESLRRILESESTFIYQSIISQRRIAIIKLKRGIETSAGTLNLLELSDQKPDNSQKDSFDHVEIYPTKESYEELVESVIKNGERVAEVKRPHHTTHDLMISEQFSVKFTHELLLEKIKRDEMV